MVDFETFTRGYSQIKAYGDVRFKGLPFHKKSLNMGPSFYQKSLNMCPFSCLRQNFYVFMVNTKKIWKMGLIIFQEKSLKMDNFFLPK